MEKLGRKFLSLAKKDPNSLIGILGLMVALAAIVALIIVLLKPILGG